MNSPPQVNARHAASNNSDSTQYSPVVDPEASEVRLRAAGDTQATEGNNITSAEYASIPAEDPTVSSARPSISTVVGDGSVLEQSQKRAESPGKLGTLNAWIFEVLALLVSITSFAAIVILLVLYDKKPQPEFAYSLNINTFIAIFTTILRATLVFMVAGVIGQSKWQWMSSPRPLRDIEVFDNAGRGAWGSLRFLFFSWKPSVAILSAFVILTSYAIGPFSQQAVKTYSCDIPAEGAAYILAAEWVGQADVNRIPVANGIWLSPEMGMTLINGLVQGVSNDSLSLSHCKSSNCTFEFQSGITHQSVGVCSACVDVRDQLAQKKSAKVVGGMDFYLQEGAREGARVADSPETEAFGMFTQSTPKALQHLLDFESTTVGTSIVTMTANNCTSLVDENGEERHHCGHHYEKLPGLGQGIDIVAANCSLYPCLRKYEGRIVNGVLNESLVFTEPMRRSLNINSVGENNGSYMSMAEPCLVGGKWYDSSNISQAPRSGMKWTSWTTKQGVQDAPSECVRVMEYEAFVGIEQFLSHRFKGLCTAYHQGTAVKTTSAALGKSMILTCTEWWHEILHREGMATFATISTAFDNMATAISNRMRVLGENWSRTGRASVSGRGTQTTICVRVDWPWLLYPATLLALSLSLLITACWGSFRDREKQPVWKSAILPLMFYDLVPDRKSLEESGERRLQLKQLESLADKTIVQL